VAVGGPLCAARCWPAGSPSAALCDHFPGCLQYTEKDYPVRNKCKEHAPLGPSLRIGCCQKWDSSQQPGPQPAASPEQHRRPGGRLAGVAAGRGGKPPAAGPVPLLALCVVRTSLLASWRCHPAAVWRVSPPRASTQSSGQPARLFFMPRRTIDHPRVSAGACRAPSAGYFGCNFLYLCTFRLPGPPLGSLASRR